MTRFVETGDGPSIALDDPGGRGLPLLFVHGFGHHRGVWRGVTAQLGPRWRPIRLDLRGHGESGWSIPGDYGLDAYAGDLLHVIEALGLERVALVAHSLGGNAATLAAAAAPERIAALALVDTGPGLSRAGLQQVAAGAAGALRSYPDRDGYRAALAIQHPLADEAALDDLMEGGFAIRRDGRLEPRLDPAALGDRPAEEEMAKLEERLWGALRGIRAPLLLVRGARSAMLTAEVAERMRAGGAEAARLVTIDRAGHSVMLDAPVALAREIEAFLSVPPQPAMVRAPRPAARPVAGVS